MANERIFNHYKNRLEDANVGGEVRFLVIQYLCGFPSIDPYKMAASIQHDGFCIVYDNSAISARENGQQHRRVAALAK